MAGHFVLLFFALSAALSSSADVFVSIDCGSTESYTDDNMMLWMGDDMYVQNGDTKVVESSKALSPVMSSLRVFSSRKKNCYSVPLDSRTQILVRASFFYGNYDNKNSPPAFDLHFDGNLWANVVTSSDQLVSYEAIYVAKGDTTSICVAQTKPGQLPFISALEVRSLGSNMYSNVDSNYVLFTRRRVAFGANETIRYSDDPYDRIWSPSIVASGLTTLTSDSALVDVSVEDDPPQAVLKNAITTSDPSEHILLGTNLPPTVRVPIYITMYFTELTELDSTQTRSFTIDVDDAPISDPIVPPYGKVTEMYVTNMTASSNTTFKLVATTDSKLPPMINAMEVYAIGGALTDGTDSKDIEVLSSLQSTFNELQDWNGDPCLPSPFTWDWLNCSTDPTPRVTALYLSSLGLLGLVPDLSSMDALEIIDLHNNSLAGPIPDFFGTLPNLKQLNLADNEFIGSIPTSLSNNKKLKLDVTGNPNLCVSGKSCTTTDTSFSSDPVVAEGGGGGGKKKSNKLPAILGSTIPTFFIFWAIAGVCVIARKKRKSAPVGSGPASSNPNGTPPPAGSGWGRKMGQAVVDELKDEVVNQFTTGGGDQEDQQANGTQQNDTPPTPDF